MNDKRIDNPVSKIKEHQNQNYNNEIFIEKSMDMKNMKEENIEKKENNTPLHDNIDDSNNEFENKSSHISKKDKIKKEIMSWVKTIIGALILVFILQNFVIINAHVPTESMVKTIEPGDNLITFRLSYLFSKPKRGDIIVFKYPDDKTQKFTKRIIGMPGEKVEIKDGKVYINDSTTPLHEPYVNGTPTGNFGPYYVPEGSYFMLGDNRENSLDSRYWKNTFLIEEDIYGKILFRYFPSFKWMDNKVVY